MKDKRIFLYADRDRYFRVDPLEDLSTIRRGEIIGVIIVEERTSPLISTLPRRAWKGLS